MSDIEKVLLQLLETASIEFIQELIKLLSKKINNNLVATSTIPTEIKFFKEEK